MNTNSYINTMINKKSSDMSNHYKALKKGTVKGINAHNTYEVIKAQKRALIEINRLNEAGFKVPDKLIEMATSSSNRYTSKQVEAIKSNLAVSNLRDLAYMSTIMTVEKAKVSLKKGQKLSLNFGKIGDINEVDIEIKVSYRNPGKDLRQAFLSTMKYGKGKAQAAQDIVNEIMTWEYMTGKSKWTDYYTSNPTARENLAKNLPTADELTDLIRDLTKENPSGARAERIALETIRHLHNEYGVTQDEAGAKFKNLRITAEKKARNTLKDLYSQRAINMFFNLIELVDNKAWANYRYTIGSDDIMDILDEISNPKQKYPYLDIETMLEIMQVGIIREDSPYEIREKLQKRNDEEADRAESNNR